MPDTPGMSNPNRTEGHVTTTTFNRERALRFAGAIDTLGDDFPIAERALQYIRADLRTVGPTGAAAAVWGTLVSNCPDASERGGDAAALAGADAAGITR